jgi:chemotaxis-related protein WspB
MLALVFQVGRERYAVEVASLVAVVPCPTLRPVPHAPAHVLGVFVYHGQVVPIVDAGRLFGGEPCPDRMSSRVLLISYRAAGDVRTIGLRVERATEVRRLDPSQMADPGLRIEDAAYLGRMFVDAGRMVQLVETERLLAAPLRALLFPAEKDGPGARGPGPE